MSLITSKKFMPLYLSFTPDSIASTSINPIRSIWLKCSNSSGCEFRDVKEILFMFVDLGCVTAVWSTIDDVQPWKIDGGSIGT